MLLALGDVPPISWLPKEVFNGPVSRLSCSVWGGGEGVIKLEPGPVFTNSTTDFFAPANWVALDAADTDIGA